MKNWTRIDDDLYTRTTPDLKMEVNFISANHWVWILYDNAEFPLAGSFLNGSFPATKSECIALCELYADRYLANRHQYLTDLQEKATTKFNVKLSLSGIQAVIIAMKIHNDDQPDINDVAKSILDQWSEYSDRFEQARL